MSDALTRIHNHIMWNRLIAVVEEEAQALIRTAFSTSVREAGDLAAAVFDRQGRMLAQAITGTPGHINSVAECVKHFLAKHPIDTMVPGIGHNNSPDVSAITRAGISACNSASLTVYTKASTWIPRCTRR